MCVCLLGIVARPLLDFIEQLATIPITIDSRYIAVMYDTIVQTAQQLQ